MRRGVRALARRAAGECETPAVTHWAQSAPTGPKSRSIAMIVAWHESTQEDYSEAFGCLPPAAIANYPSPGFLVGEALNHRNGVPTFRAYCVVAGKYWRSAEGLTFADFKSAFPDACRY